MIANKKERATSRLSQSNRENTSRFDLDKQASEAMSEALSQSAVYTDGEILKHASFASGFQMFGNVKKSVASALGVSDTIAEELTSKIITKSEHVIRDYGGEQIEVISGIIDEMKNQSISNPDILNGAFDLHPVTHQSRQIEETIKLRLMNEMHMSNRDADTFKTVVYKNAQDLTTTLRPHTRENIAKALVDLIIDTKDQTIVYNIKTSPTLLESLKAFL